MYSIKIDYVYYGKFELEDTAHRVLAEAGWPEGDCFREHVRVINGKHKWAAVVYIGQESSFDFFHISLLLTVS